MSRFNTFCSAVGLRVAEVLLFISPFIIGCVWFYAGICVENRRLNRYFSCSEYSELRIACDADISKEFSVKVGGATYKVVYMRTANPIFFLASGCPVLIYDGDGFLLDRTPDVGKDAGFRQKWKLTTLQELPIVLLSEVRVKAVERKVETVAGGEAAAATDAVAIVCGMDEATAGRNEVRNDALRSIARRRDLAKNDVDALLAYLRKADDAMRGERVAALKNNMMNLLRNQEPPVEGLAETLIAMIEGRPVAGFGRSGRAGVPPPAADGDGTPSLPGNTIHPPVVIDYCIQHLGAMVNELDGAGRKAVRGVLRG